MENNQKIKLATAFSGGLAAPEFALKYEDINHEVIFACEWDKYARKQYIEFHSEPKNFYNDISDLNATKYKNEVDLFIWGSPCQDLSLAGKRKGFDGEKSSLFREGARVLSEMMPKVFIFENVKGLLSSNGGNDYKEVVKTFQDLGYLIASKVVNAKEHGTAQNRERVFIVGFLDVEEYHSFNFAEPGPLTKVLKDYLEDDVKDSYYLSDKAIRRITVSNRGVAPGDEDTKIAPCLIAQYSKIPTDGFYIKSATKCGYEVAKDGDGVSLSHIGSSTGRGRVGSNQCQTLTTSGNHGVVDQERIRKLTERECFRLQGVEDEDINLVNSSTQSYKIAGNAIEVNTMRSIIRQLYKPSKIKNSLF